MKVDGDASISFGTEDLAAYLSTRTDGKDRIRIDPDCVEQDLARLVLGLMEFLRQLMELQAIRRMENGQLTPEQEETLGTTLMRAEGAIHDLADRFGLSPEDLSLDLGPLGRTV
ncbi:putative gas vesicle synthesis protein [Rhodovulum sp. P5]|uniref:gas vesicle protein K n=1 Tax=Rhodovulum sp. P5 TaxID=1564506 RepID=UPI0009C2C0BB|nr:gas vesicle protein K [Rhodovulum sp. P5]ARE42212.1 putative gas vesicle synthesis protein [Rhodovulum sp. P5]